jgi:hypothetical protein
MSIVRSVVLTATVLAVPFLATPTQAAPIVFSGSSGTLAASASFDIVLGNLQVTLTNTSASDVLVPSNVLTAVFFDLAGVGALTPVSALVAAGSTVNAADPAGLNVGGEWAYGSGLVGPAGATEGISSSGFGLFGGGNFNGPDLDSPAAVNGMNYGILSAGDNTATGNAPILSEPFTKNQVIFLLSGLPVGFSLDGAISKVSFQYGTALTEPNVGGGTTGGVSVPEPATLSLLGAGFAVAVARLRRRKTATLAL